MTFDMVVLLVSQFVPEGLKDEKYWARRRKNNMAAKRSRDARRMKENQIALRAGFLEKEVCSLCIYLFYFLLKAHQHQVFFGTRSRYIAVPVQCILSLKITDREPKKRKKDRQLDSDPGLLRQSLVVFLYG